jgi:hypothetical protein
VHYLGALQRYRVATASNPRLLQMSSFLVHYPFASRLYPRALDAVRHLWTWGLTVILSHGDVVFQPRRLWAAVEGRVLIYIHKEEMLDAVAERYPARRYLMVDDTLRTLATRKEKWKGRLTTIFPRQGHYALDAKQVAQAEQQVAQCRGAEQRANHRPWPGEFLPDGSGDSEDRPKECQTDQERGGNHPASQAGSMS